MTTGQYKPTIVEQNSAKRTHMSRVDEHQILNGHYVRLRSVRAAIDKATPRSQHTLAKIRRQLTPNNKKSNRPAEIGHNIRSHSLELKRTTSELTITKINERNISQDNPRIKPLSLMEIRRIQLSQSMTLKPRRMINAQQTILSKSFNYGPYVKGRSLSNQYERRFLDLDVIDKDFYLFNQPNKPFNPRQLLFNLQQSKVAKMRVYNPPTRRKGKNNNLNLSTTWHGQIFDQENNGTDFLDESNSHLSESLRHIQRERLSPNTFNLKRHSRSDMQFIKPNLSKEEMEEIMAWNFLREVTENLILAQTYTDTALYQIFELAMENWKMKLPLTKLKSLISKLLDDLFIKKEGALSVFQEPKDIVTPIIHEPSEIYEDYSDPGEASPAESEHEDDNNSIELSEKESIKEDNDNRSKRSAENSTKSSKKQTSVKEVSKTKIASKIPKSSKIIKQPVQVQHSDSEIEEHVEEDLEEHENDHDADDTAHRGAVTSDNEEPYEESVADSRAQTPIVQSFKEQDVSNVESVFDQDKSSEATMGEVSDIEEDDNSMLSNRKVVQKVNQTKPKLDDVKQQNIQKVSKPTTKNGKNRRKYSWESSDSEKVPVKETPKKNATNQESSSKPVVEEQIVPPLGPREDTMQSLNDETKSLSQSKPKERRRWWPSSREGSVSSIHQTSFDQQDNGLPPTVSGIDDIRKKREPFLQKLEETKSLSDRSVDGVQNSPKRKASVVKNSSMSSERAKEQNKEEQIGDEQSHLSNHINGGSSKGPVPAKRHSISRSSTPDNNRGAVIGNEEKPKHLMARKSTTTNAHSEDDEGVFYIPEDATLRGDYGGRRLSQVINEIASEPVGDYKRSQASARHSLSRSPRVSSSDENISVISKELMQQYEKRRNSNASSLRMANNTQHDTIYEGDETNSSVDLQKLKKKLVPTEDKSSESGDEQQQPSDEKSSSDELQLTKTTKVLKNALNTLALVASSDESDKNEG